MRVIDKREIAGQRVEFAPQVLTRPQGDFDISGDLVVALPALLVDGLAIVLLSLASGIGYHYVAFHRLIFLNAFVGSGVLTAVLFCGMTRVLGTTQATAVSRGMGRARLALLAWITTFLLLVFVAFSLKVGQEFSRGSILSFFLLGAPLVVSTRVVVPRFLARTLYAYAYRGNEVVIAVPRGSVAHEPITESLRRQGCDGVHTIQFDIECAPANWPAERQRLLNHIIETARGVGPGEIYLFGTDVSQERVSSIQAGLRLVPRAVYVVPTDAVMRLLALPVRRVGSTVAVEMQPVPMSAASKAIKRVIDIVVAGIALTLAVPAFVLIALAIKIDSRGPVFFKQRRNGYRGRPFRIFKYRTMTVLEDGDIVQQAGREDHRVTRVGRWLRKTSLDELPQLFNILRGEMSLVGPRPHAVAHDKDFAELIENYELRQHVKPGITGWAQVNGLRGKTPTIDLMYRRIEHDLWYASNCSVALDLQILAQTLVVVLRQHNAY